MSQNPNASSFSLRGAGAMSLKWKSAVIAAVALLAVSGIVVALINLPVISGVVPR